MRKIFIVISILLSVTLLASCEEAQSHGTLRINLENDGSRSILPEGYPLEIASYRITGTGPAGAALDIETSKTSTTVDGMAVGEWQLHATALNENGDALVRGSTSVKITGRSTNATIILDELIGKGDVTINLSWDPDVLTGDARIEIEFVPEYGDVEISQLTRYSLDEAAGKATYKGKDYPSGSYRLSAQLYEGGKEEPLAGFTEAVRIADGQESIGSIEFDMDKYPSDPSTIELVNTTGVPVTLSITGLSDTVTADVPIEVSLSSDSDDIGTFQITWHLNGRMIGEGRTISITPTEGVHRLDAVASTSRTGSSGSASFNFEAIAAADPGAPNQGNIVHAASSGIKMGLGMVAEFLPNGEVMIASNTSRILQICSIVRSSLVVEKTYPYADLSIDAGQTIAAFATGEKSTKEYRIFMLLNSPLEASLYSYSPETRAMSLSVQGMTDDDITVVSEASRTPVNALYAGINMEKEVGIAVLGDSSRKYAGAFLFPLDADTTSAFEDTTEKNFASTFIEGYPECFTYDDSLFVASEGAYFAGHVDDGASSPYVTMITPLAFVDGFETKFADTAGLAILSSESILAVSDDAVIISAEDSWNEYTSEPLGFTAAAVAVSPDKRYAYMLDADTPSLVSYKVLSNGREIGKFSTTDLQSSGLNQIRISESGHSILLFDDTRCDAITVMSVNR